MVKQVASSQILNSQASYLQALANVNRIEQAIDLKNKRRNVVDFPRYIEAFSTLVSQMQVREQLGIASRCKELHTKLDTALQSLSGKVVSVAAQTGLAAAAKAANASPRPNNNAKPWTLRQKVIYGTAAIVAGGALAYAPRQLWETITSIPGMLKTLFFVAKNGIPTATSGARTFGAAAGTFATGAGAVIGGARQAATAVGLDVPPSPTDLESTMGLGFGFIANYFLCKKGGNMIAPAFSVLTDRVQQLPTRETMCLLLSTIESVRPGTTLSLASSGYSAAGTIGNGALSAADTAAKAIANISFSALPQEVIDVAKQHPVATTAAGTALTGGEVAIRTVPYLRQKILLPIVAGAAVGGAVAQQAAAGQAALLAVQQAALPFVNRPVVNAAIQAVIRAAQQARPNGAQAVVQAVQRAGIPARQAGAAASQALLRAAQQAAAAAPVMVAPRNRFILIRVVSAVGSTLAAVLVGALRLAHLRRPW